jgi:hypothetical protein
MIRKHRVTLTTTGSAGSATATATLTLGRPGFVRAIAVDYHASAPVTTDLTIKADSASGNTLFTNSNSVTDIAAKPVGMPGVDEANAALAATDSSSGGWPFGTGLYLSVAQSDALTGAAVVDVWIET